MGISKQYATPTVWADKWESITADELALFLGPN